ncbi:hypothetical protein BHM03_00022752 [Ensete ventricosum]|nr:hypothetical protein BHM03_00022752 [Ensete ventricosum]
MVKYAAKRERDMSSLYLCPRSVAVEGLGYILAKKCSSKLVDVLAISALLLVPKILYNFIPWSSSQHGMVSSECTKSSTEIFKKRWLGG